MVYIGLPDNPQFLGRQNPQELARHILRSRGPSGENRAYLYQLEQALLHLSSDSTDEHISDLVRRCKELEAREGAAVGRDVENASVIGSELKKVGSTEEQEEVEKT